MYEIEIYYAIPLNRSTAPIPPQPLIFPHISDTRSDVLFGGYKILKADDIPPLNC